jgi:hypothetical protein
MHSGKLRDAADDRHPEPTGTLGSRLESIVPELNLVQGKVPGNVVLLISGAEGF